MRSAYYVMLDTGMDECDRTANEKATFVYNKILHLQFVQGVLLHLLPERYCLLITIIYLKFLFLGFLSL